MGIKSTIEITRTDALDRISSALSNIDNASNESLARLLEIIDEEIDDNMGTNYIVNNFIENQSSMVSIYYKD